MVMSFCGYKFHVPMFTLPGVFALRYATDVISMGRLEAVNASTLHFVLADSKHGQTLAPFRRRSELFCIWGVQIAFVFSVLTGTSKKKHTTPFGTIGILFGLVEHRCRFLIELVVS